MVPIVEAGDVLQQMSKDGIGWLRGENWVLNQDEESPRLKNLKYYKGLHLCVTVLALIPWAMLQKYVAVEPKEPRQQQNTTG